jgi:molecular chaperone GrpE
LIFAAPNLISPLESQQGPRDADMIDTTEQEQGDPTGPADAAGPEARAPADPYAAVEALTAENASLKDRLLRTMAEMENVRRRTEREVADARAYGVSSFARDLLGVADNLARALDSLPEEKRAKAEGPLKALIDGVELTMRDLVAALARHGVTKLEPLGERFDPNFHQAMFEAPDPTVPAGTVAEVLQSGWRIGDRVLRPAMVGVSKGGPKVVAKAD